MWGRQYQCDGGALPRQIVNQGEEMLAAPVTLRLAADGSTADLAASGGHKRSGLAGRGGSSAPKPGSAGWESSLATTTEFDGSQRYDLTLTPAAPVEVTDLVLEVPVKAKYASFLLPSNGISANAVTMGTAAWRRPSCPRCGWATTTSALAWFAESDQWWRPHDEQMLEVAPEGDRTVLRCKMVRSDAGTRQSLRLDEAGHDYVRPDGHAGKAGPAGDPFWFRFGDELARPAGADGVI